MSGFRYLVGVESLLNGAADERTATTIEQEASKPAKTKTELAADQAEALQIGAKRKLEAAVETANAAFTAQAGGPSAMRAAAQAVAAAKKAQADIARAEVEQLRGDVEVLAAGTETRLTKLESSALDFLVSVAQRVDAAVVAGFLSAPLQVLRDQSQRLLVLLRAIRESLKEITPVNADSEVRSSEVVAFSTRAAGAMAAIAEALSAHEKGLLSEGVAGASRLEPLLASHFDLKARFQSYSIQQSELQNVVTAFAVALKTVITALAAEEGAAQAVDASGASGSVDSKQMDRHRSEIERQRLTEQSASIAKANGALSQRAAAIDAAGILESKLTTASGAVADTAFATAAFGSGLIVAGSTGASPARLGPVRDAYERLNVLVSDSQRLQPEIVSASTAVLSSAASVSWMNSQEISFASQKLSSAIATALSQTSDQSESSALNELVVSAQKLVSKATQLAQAQTAVATVVLPSAASLTGTAEVRQAAATQSAQRLAQQLSQTLTAFSDIHGLATSALNAFSAIFTGDAGVTEFQALSVAAAVCLADGMAASTACREVLLLAFDSDQSTNLIVARSAALSDLTNAFEASSQLQIRLAAFEATGSTSLGSSEFAAWKRTALGISEQIRQMRIDGTEFISFLSTGA